MALNERQCGQILKKPEKQMTLPDVCTNTYKIILTLHLEIEKSEPVHSDHDIDPFELPQSVPAQSLCVFY
jgi:hypothetical protein